MQINKQQLQKALEIVKPGLSNKDIIEQATSFAFINGHVVTYNDEISISHPVEGLEIEGAVKADKLYSLLSKIKAEEIEIEIKDAEIIIQAGRSKAGLTLESEIKLPLDEEISEKGKWMRLPETFNKHVSFAMTCCSRDMSKPILTCVNIKKDGIVEASDSFRIIQCNMKQAMLVDTFLLPASSAMTVVKLNPTKVCEGKGWIHFKTEENTIISCRIFEDNFPDVSAHLKVKGTQLTFPKNINEIIDRASIFAKRDHMLDETLILSIENKRLKIRAESDSGWFEEKVITTYEGDPISFAITPYLLKGILSETLNCIVSKDKLKFEGENWQYITALKQNK